MSAPLLLITATALEAAPLKDELENLTELDFPLGELYRGRLSRVGPVYLAHLGVAKVNTAAGLALAIAKLQPRAVIQFGIGGAYIGSFLSVGMLAVAKREIHIDTGLKTENWQDMAQLGFPLLKKKQTYHNVFPTDASLSKALARVTGATICTFGSSETVTGNFADAQALQQRFDLSIESMEGAAAAQVCLALDTPFAELRAVSNIVGERNKQAWNIPLAVRAANEALLSFCKLFLAQTNT